MGFFGGVLDRSSKAEREIYYTTKKKRQRLEGKGKGQAPQMIEKNYE